MNIDDMMLTEPDLRQKMEAVTALAKTKIVEAPSNNYAPTLFVFHPKPDGKIGTTLILLVGGDWNHNKTRYKMMAKTAAVCYEERMLPLGAVLISEMWMAKERNGVEPRYCPDRQEILGASGMTVEGNVLLAAHMPIARVRGIMRPCSDWVWATGKVENNILGHFFNSFLKEAAERIGFVRTCRVCGCTDNNCEQCVQKTGEPCHWVEPDLCSACQEVKSDK